MPVRRRRRRPRQRRRGQGTAANDDVVGVSRGQDRIPADAGGHRVEPPTSAAMVVSSDAHRSGGRGAPPPPNGTDNHDVAKVL